MLSRSVVSVLGAHGPRLHHATARVFLAPRLQRVAGVESSARQGMHSVSYPPIADLAAAIRGGSLSASALAQALLERNETPEAKNLNVYYKIDAEQVLRAARIADQEIASGKYRGALHGVPVSVKDLADTQGLETTGGSSFFRTRVPTSDATLVRRLKDAGAVIFGKLATHEWAWGVTSNNPHFGPTRNPHDTTRIPGGSSGGSSAAIAANLAIATIGTDTGGSIRIPSALCGTVGLKPTYGLVSKQGVIPLSDSFDHAGPITRTVEDAAIVLSAIAGYDPLDPTTNPLARAGSIDYHQQLLAADTKSLRGVRIGVPRKFFFDPLQSCVGASVERAIRELESLGATVSDAPDLGCSADNNSRLFTIAIAESIAYHRERIDTRLQGFGEDVREILSTPLPPAWELARIHLELQEFRARARTVMEQFDVLVTPTCRSVAARIGETTVRIDSDPAEHALIPWFASLTMPFNFTGQPVLALPCGFSDDSKPLPIGISIAGRLYDEPTVLRVGRAYERLRAQQAA